MLWIAVPLALAFITGVALCTLMLWLRSQRTHCRLLSNEQGRDLTMVKVASGEDPTYGVRLIIYLLQTLHFTLIQRFMLQEAILSLI